MKWNSRAPLYAARGLSSMLRVVGVGHTSLDPHLVVEHVEQFVRITRVTPVEPFQIAFGFG